MTMLSVLLLQDLLYRRMRSLANLEAANKKLETARNKNKGFTEVTEKEGGEIEDCFSL